MFARHDFPATATLWHAWFAWRPVIAEKVVSIDAAAKPVADTEAYPRCSPVFMEHIELRRVGQRWEYRLHVREMREDEDDRRQY